MTLLSIHRLPDPILKQPTRRIERLTDEVRHFIEMMIRTMRHHPRCVGLAAPQVGKSMRLAVMDVSAHPKATHSHGLLVLVNPQLERLGEPVIQREGCLSIPDFTANVNRVTQVRLRAWDESGAHYEMDLEGFEAVVAQHEVDHLDGKLFLDRVANLKIDVFHRKTYL